MMCTYLEEYEFEKFKTVPDDEELNDLLQEVNQKFGNRYLIEKSTHYHTSWFKKIKYTHYNLYAILNKPEVQVIAFPSIKGDSENISRSLIITYFLGMLNALRRIEQKTQNQPA